MNINLAIIYLYKGGILIFRRVRAILHNLRFKTTFNWHHKATKIAWYKRWHDFKFAHHFHVFLVFIYFFSLLASLVAPTAPNAYAANGTWSQTTFNGTSDGTYSSTVAANTNNDIGLSIGKTGLSNASGGVWQYKKPITINNSGAELTDYQVLIDSENGVIGNWNLDETSGNALDSSRRGNTLINTSSVTRNVDVKYGKGITTNGSSNYMTVANNPSLNPTTQVSMEMWFKPLENIMDYQGVAGKGGGNSFELGYEFGTNGGQFGFWVNGGGNMASTSKPVNGVLSHWVGTYDGAAIKLYKDGIKIAETPYSGAITSTTLPFNIGRVSSASGGNKANTAGNFDEVKLYNRSLTQEEVTASYQNYYWNKIKSDFSDIRITDADQQAELPYWIEEYNNAINGIKNHKIWTKIPNIPATGSKNIYIYSGNSNATFATDCATNNLAKANCARNTFPVGDDFSGALDTSYWTSDVAAGGSNSVSGGELNIYSADNYYGHIEKSSGVSSFVAQTKLRATAYQASWTPGISLYWSTNETVQFQLSFSSWSVTELTNGGGAGYNLGNITPTAGTAYYLRIKLTPTQIIYEYSLDNITWTTARTGARSANWTGNPLVVYGKAFNSPPTYANPDFDNNYSTYGGFVTTYIDNAIVRKYASVEPNLSLGVEVAAGNADSGSYLSGLVPDSVTASHSGKVYQWGNLSFTADTSATGSGIHFHIMQADGTTLVSDAVLSGNSTGFTSSPISLAGLNSGNTTSYSALKIRADLSGDGNGTPLLQSWDVGYSYDVTAPSDPSSLAFSNTSSSSTTISWTTSTDNESGLATPAYYIERALDNAGIPGTWTEIGTTNSTSYTDNGLLQNTKYYYRLKAKDAVNNNSYSEYLGIYTQASKPNISFQNITNNSKPSISGMTTANISVKLLNDNIEIASTTSNGSGNFTFSELSYTGTLTEGSNNLIVRALNSASPPVGNNSDEFVINLDTQASNTSLTSSPVSADGLSGYFKTNPIITLNGSDPAPSVAGLITKYIWDDSSFTAPSTYTAPIDMNATIGQGTHTLYWRTVDAAGNIEQIRSQDFKLDSVAPSGTLEFTEGQWLTLNPVSLTISGEDSTSGMGNMQFSNSGLESEYSVLENFNNYKTGWDLTNAVYGGSNTQGDKIVYAKIYDQAGNYVIINTGNAVFDDVKPTNPDVSVVATPSSPINDWFNDVSPEFTLNGSIDETSGIDGYYIYFGENESADPVVDGEYQDSNLFNPTILNEESGKTYYLRVRAKDNAGNVYTNNNPGMYTLFIYKIDVTKPERVSFVTPNPAGWSAVNSFSFSWPQTNDQMVNSGSSGLKGYEYKRFNDENWVFTTETSVSEIQSYQTEVNVFLIRTVDNADNRSDEIPVNYYYSGSIAGPDNLQVDISQSGNQTINRYKFTWAAPIGVTAEGYYYSVNSVPNTQNSTYTTDNFTGYEAFATQQGLNTFYIVTKDSNGNVGWSNFSQVSFTCNTAAPGIAQSVLISDSSNRDTSRWQLTINWDTPTSVTPDFNGYVVERSTDGNNYTQIATTSAQTTGYLDTGLSNNTTYYYRVRTKDNTGNVSAQSSEVFKVPTGRFTTPPNILGQPKVEIQATKVSVEWTTDRASDSFIQIGTDTSYGMTQGQLESTHSHKVTASGLQPGTTYHYRAMWRDSDGNIGYSNDSTFRTQDAPGISEVSISDVRLNSAIISWKTTTVSTSKIFYGKTNTYGMTAVDQSSSQVTTHTIKLENLDHSSTYHFKIQGTDTDGNVLSSDDYSFETLTFPRISGVKLEQQSNESTSTVKLTWKTNVPTSSTVLYTGGGTTKEASKSLLETTHSMVVTNLKDNSQYSFSVRGRDAYGNEATADSISFKTAFDTRPPQNSDITIETSIVGFGAEAKGQVIISWETDELSTSQVEYGLGVGGDYTQSTQEDTSLTTTHVVVISGLKPSSSYHFRVISRDEAGNFGKSEDNTILTEQASSSVLDVVINSLRSTLGWLFGAIAR